MHQVAALAIAPVAGVIVGGAAQLAPVDPGRGTALALTAAFGVAIAVAPFRAPRDASPGGRFTSAARVLAAAFAFAWTAAAVAGRPGAAGGAALVAGAAAAACGATAWLRSRGVGLVRSAVAGAAAPCALAGLVFVADPFIEWNGSTTASAPVVADLVVRLDPVASLAASAGVDRGHSRWMYYGTEPGSPGLSVAGQYYATQPTPPWLWALAATAAGAAALAAARPRSTIPS